MKQNFRRTANAALTACAAALLWTPGCIVINAEKHRTHDDVRLAHEPETPIDSHARRESPDPASQAVAITATGAQPGADAALVPPRTPFHQLVEDWTHAGSPFADPSTLHGEVDDAWYPGYVGIDVAPPAAPTGADSADVNADPEVTAASSSGPVQWPMLQTPNWARNQPDQPATLTLDVVEPAWPSEPVVTMNPRTGAPDFYRVDGRFLVGAARWMHEEAVEEWMSGARPELAEADRVPVYWVVGYQLFIPADYGTEAAADRNGRALIINGNGRRALPEGVRPPWMSQVLTRREFREDMAIDLVRRLRVPILYLTQFPVDERETRAAEIGSAGNYTYALGYTAEGKVYTVNWALENGDYRDHPQYLFGATFVRGVTFLNGFFNPEVHGTSHWSQWDEIVAAQTSTGDEGTGGGTAGAEIPGVEIDDVIIHGGSKRANAALIAGLADSRITAVISNGMAYFDGERMAHRQMDEMWDQRDAPRDRTAEGRGSEVLSPDPDQARSESSMSTAIDRLRAHATGAARTFSPYYELSTIFRDAGGRFPVAPVDIYHTAGAQDPFWPLLAWRDWFEEGEFPRGSEAAGQFLDLNPFAGHPPTYAEWTEKVAGFIQHVWNDRPMPSVRIVDVHYQLPIEDEAPESGRVPLRVTGELRIARSDRWRIPSLANLDSLAATGNEPPASPELFDDLRLTLAVGLRPQHAEMSRGMWSETPPLARQWPAGVKRRMTPWWEIDPVPGSVRLMSDPRTADEVVVRADFEVASDAYADTRPDDAVQSPWFPPGFEGAFADGLRLDGIPENYHVAIYVRGAVRHEPATDSDGADSGHDPAWPVRTSTPVLYLPPWQAHFFNPTDTGGGMAEEESGG